MQSSDTPPLSISNSSWTKDDDTWQIIPEEEETANTTLPTQEMERARSHIYVPVRLRRFALYTSMAELYLDLTRSMHDFKEDVSSSLLVVPAPVHVREQIAIIEKIALDIVQEEGEYEARCAQEAAAPAPAQDTPRFRIPQLAIPRDMYRPSEAGTASLATRYWWTDDRDSESSSL
ncbi:hypothetical protein CALCODRAFT_531668 [Calocera cornea HHB12733]|uniref:Uncharacterized protein n=1 Tax=Calocera cornea HHB12733 TaxID=1353952 RepID=A0A165D7M7_9BASI|nr:hypothetical protein CALCODRAFT_531668 [Calocera cornea HHB12733]